jgi:hypothetical protein
MKSWCLLLARLLGVIAAAVFLLGPAAVPAHAKALLPVSHSGHGAAKSGTAAANPPAVAAVSKSANVVFRTRESATVTVLVTDMYACGRANRPTFVLATTSPEGIGKDPAASGCKHQDGSTYAVTLRFTFHVALAEIPAGATLLLSQRIPGTAAPAEANVSLTVQRWMSPWAYLWGPLLTGAGMAAVLVVLICWIGLPCRRRPGKNGPEHEVVHFSAKFWTRPLYATASWTFSDSWATNITVVGTSIGAVLTAAGAFSAVLPGVQLGPFTLLNVGCGAAVVAGPILFGVLKYFSAGSYRMIAPDVTIEAPLEQGDSQESRITLLVPAGAAITAAGGALVGAAGAAGGAGAAKGTTGKGAGGKGAAEAGATVKAGGTIPVPPGTTITIHAGSVAAPGTTDIGLGSGGIFSLDRETRIASGDCTAATQAAPVTGSALTAPPAGGLVHALLAKLRPKPATAPGPADAHVPAHTHITVTAGAKITVVGVADVRIPAGANVISPDGTGNQDPSGTKGRRHGRPAPGERLTIPAGTSVIQADPRSMVPAAVLTMFAIGTELGMIVVLAVFFSAARGYGICLAWILSALVAAGVLSYGATAMRSLANPQPGSSLSSDASTSFTL